jgi:hypothetical protein
MEKPQLSEPVPAFICSERCRTPASLNQGRYRFDLDSRYAEKKSSKSTPTRHKAEARDGLDSLGNGKIGIANLDSLKFTHRCSSYDLDTPRTNHSLKSPRGTGPGHQASGLQTQLTDALIAYKGKQRAMFQDQLNAILTPRPSHRAQSCRASTASILSTSKGLSSPHTPTHQHLLTFLHTTTPSRQQRSFTRGSSTAQPPPTPSPSALANPANPAPPNPKPTQLHHQPKPATARPTTLAQASSHPNPIHPTTPRPPPPDFATLRSDPKFKALSRKWTSVMVALPIAIYTTWVLLERCEPKFLFRLVCSI